MGKFGKAGITAAAAATMAVVGIGGQGYFNPALAAKIPLIGKSLRKLRMTSYIPAIIRIRELF